MHTLLRFDLKYSLLELLSNLAKDRMLGKIFSLKYASLKNINIWKYISFIFKEIREYIGDLPEKTKSIINFEHFWVIINLKDGDIIERALNIAIVLSYLNNRSYDNCKNTLYQEKWH